VDRHLSILKWSTRPGVTCADPATSSLASLLEWYAIQSPQSLTFVDWSWGLDFAGLNRRDSELARQLQQFGVGPGEMVGVRVEDSPPWLINVLGINRVHPHPDKLSPGWVPPTTFETDRTPVPQFVVIHRPPGFHAQAFPRTLVWDQRTDPVITEDNTVLGQDSRSLRSSLPSSVEDPRIPQNSESRKIPQSSGTHARLAEPIHHRCSPRLPGLWFCKPGWSTGAWRFTDLGVPVGSLAGGRRQRCFSPGPTPKLTLETIGSGRRSCVRSQSRSFLPPHLNLLVNSGSGRFPS